jgi:hypothetical protein
VSEPSQESTIRRDPASNFSEKSGKLEDSSSSEQGNEYKLVPEEEYGFAHPAASRPQRIVWLPKDTLGLAMEEEKSIRDAGIFVSLAGAEMDAKGKVDVSRGPPDMIEDEEVE